MKDLEIEEENDDNEQVLIVNNPEIENILTYLVVRPHSKNLVLKGIIGYSDYSLAMEIFECFQANRIFICYFKASHLCTLAVC